MLRKGRDRRPSRSPLSSGEIFRRSTMNISNEQMLALYRKMVEIRTFEETAREIFLAGKLAGFLHLYSGEEAIATGICAHLTDKDCIVSNHRGHGHTIAKGGEYKPMMAELFGRTTGYCKGKGGSMHIADFSKGIMGANGIVGAGAPIGVGVAFGQRYIESDGITVVFFGDGASNRGTIHEAMNMAACLELPVLFVCENNGFGMSTQKTYSTKIEKISDRAAAYGFEGETAYGNDVFTVYEVAGRAIEHVRSSKKPMYLEFLTWRHYGHFVGDPANYKAPEDQAAWLEKDPIPACEKVLLEKGVATQEDIDAIKAEYEKAIREAIEYAEASPTPDESCLLEGVYSNLTYNY